MRIELNISEGQLQRVDALAARFDVTRDEAVRRGLEAVLAQPSPARPMNAADEAAVFARVFGSWKPLGIDGLEWQRKLRAEWDDDVVVE